MSKVCVVCGKRKTSGNSVTFSHRAIKRSFSPNLRKVRIYDENGRPHKEYVCSRCLRSGKVLRHPPVKSGLTDELLADTGLEEETVDEAAVVESQEA